MIKLPEDISAGDVHQWLNGGTVYADTRGGGRIIGDYIGHYEDDPSRVELMNNADGSRIVVRTRDIYVHWPYCGALNYQNFALFLVRQQARQYRRTYNARQLTIQIPRKWEAMKLYGSEISTITPGTMGIVTQAFNPTYVPFSEAVQQLQSKAAFSRAINPHIILVGAEDNTLVYYKQVYVGYIDASGKLLPVNADAQTLRRLLKHFEGRVTL